MKNRTNLYEFKHEDIINIIKLNSNKSEIGVYKEIYEKYLLNQTGMAYSAAEIIKSVFLAFENVVKEETKAELGIVSTFLSVGNNLTGDPSYKVFFETELEEDKTIVYFTYERVDDEEDFYDNVVKEALVITKEYFNKQEVKDAITEEIIGFYSKKIATCYEYFIDRLEEFEESGFGYNHDEIVKMITFITYKGFANKVIKKISEVSIEDNEK